MSVGPPVPVHFVYQFDIFIVSGEKFLWLSLTKASSMSIGLNSWVAVGPLQEQVETRLLSASNYMVMTWNVGCWSQSQVELKISSSPSWTSLHSPVQPAQGAKINILP